MAKVKKTLALEIISFKHPQTNETALVRTRLKLLLKLLLMLLLMLLRIDSDWCLVARSSNLLLPCVSALRCGLPPPQEEAGDWAVAA